MGFLWSHYIFLTSFCFVPKLIYCYCIFRCVPFVGRRWEWISLDILLHNMGTSWGYPFCKLVCFSCFCSWCFYSCLLQLFDNFKLVFQLFNAHEVWKLVHMIEEIGSEINDFFSWKVEINLCTLVFGKVRCGHFWKSWNTELILTYGRSLPSYFLFPYLLRSSSKLGQDLLVGKISTCTFIAFNQKKEPLI